MLKYKFIFFLLLASLNSFSQCDYQSILYDNATKTLYIKSNALTLELYETPYNGRFVQAFLVRNGNSFFIELEITRDSASQNLKPTCFEKGDRVSFSLSNNENISLIQVEDKICGIKNEAAGDGFTTVTDFLKVVITQDAFDKLSKNKVVLMRINSKNYNQTFVLKSELEELINNELVITDPSSFFIETVDCLVKPNFKR